jgi:hypothetical protein
MGITNVVPMVRKSTTLSLNSDAVALRSGNVVDFQETRMRQHSLVLQFALRSLAERLARTIKCDLLVLEALETEREEDLADRSYAVFDFVDQRITKKKGILSAQWIPFAVFVKGRRVLSLHASYDVRGARLQGITLIDNGKEIFTTCSKMLTAEKVCSSYLKSYVLPLVEGNS